MQKDIHPEYKETTVECSCGTSFVTKSTYDKDVMKAAVCSSCHPFYTGKSRFVNQAGRVDKFKKKFGLK